MYSIYDINIAIMHKCLACSSLGCNGRHWDLQELLLKGYEGQESGVEKPHEKQHSGQTEQQWDLRVLAQAEVNNNLKLLHCNTVVRNVNEYVRSKEKEGFYLARPLHGSLSTFTNKQINSDDSKKKKKKTLFLEMKYNPPTSPTTKRVVSSYVMLIKCRLVHHFHTYPHPIH